ncbi:hypothetical protein [Streptomyces sp. NPDC053048]|uniref:hypothetical protein n=1 Tax=Streptomyces sp. NPDC053048 TaxID=3365694 RepID=UPI0037D516F2
MVAPEGELQLAERTAALCGLLAESDGHGHGDARVREAVARAVALLRAPARSEEELAVAFRAVDDALRRAGDARGLLGRFRGAPVSRAAVVAPGLPGLRPAIRVALCPGEVPCTRREPARDLWPAPQCPLHGARMRKERLARDR